MRHLRIKSADKSVCTTLLQILNTIVQDRHSVPRSGTPVCSDKLSADKKEGKACLAPTICENLRHLRINNQLDATPRTHLKVRPYKLLSVIARSEATKQSIYQEQEIASRLSAVRND
jgi:hypothetical protein